MDHSVPTRGYLIYRTTNKLKQEFADLNKAEIIALRGKGVEITEKKKSPVVGVFV
jgi:hypothetical protein